MNELPEPWNTAAEHAGVTQSLRGIASAAGVSHVTVGRLIRQGRTSPQTVSAVAAALRISEAKVYEYAGISLSDLGPWIPPLEAHRLNPRARAALSELILAITEGEGGSSASTGEPDEKSKRPAISAGEDANAEDDSDTEVIGFPPGEVPPGMRDMAAHRTKRPKGTAFGNQDPGE